MTTQEAALVRLARSLAGLEVPYMVIGGHANAVWGEPRATLDIDVTVLREVESAVDLAEHLSPHFRPRVDNVEDFVRDTRVLPMETPHGLGVDLIFGLLPFEQDAVARAAVIEVQGEEVRFCTAEDLILLKIVSERERDLSDIRGVVRRQGEHLDLGYLEGRIRELADLLGRPEIQAFWRSLKTEIPPG